MGLLRHEYPEQIERVRLEIDRAEQLGALGSNIFGSGRRFELDLFVSPGGYICGEQTALIEAMEDRRAEPTEPATGTDDQRLRQSAHVARATSKHLPGFPRS